MYNEVIRCPFLCTAPGSCWRQLCCDFVSSSLLTHSHTHTTKQTHTSIRIRTVGTLYTSMNHVNKPKTDNRNPNRNSNPKPNPTPAQLELKPNLKLNLSLPACNPKPPSDSFAARLGPQCGRGQCLQGNPSRLLDQIAVPFSTFSRPS